MGHERVNKKTAEPKLRRTLLGSKCELKKLENEIKPWSLHQAKLRKNTVAGHVLSCQTNDKSEHSQTTIPVLGELSETHSFALVFHNALNLNEVNKSKH